MPPPPVRGRWPVAAAYPGRMDRYVAFLRGMNLGKNRRIKNPELLAEFERLGFEDVATFRASGNVVFGADGGGEAALTSGSKPGWGRGSATGSRSSSAAPPRWRRSPPGHPSRRRRSTPPRASCRWRCCRASRRRRRARRVLELPARRTCSRSRAASSSGCRAAARSSPSST